MTGAGLMHRLDGCGAPGGFERMMCGALYPPMPPEKVPSPATSAVAAEAPTKMISIQQPVPSGESACCPSAASPSIISMLHPHQWLPSEISLLHLGSGWLGHGGSVDKLLPPSSNFSDPMRSSSAPLPPACQLAEPLSWSPLEDERLAIEAATAAGIKAAELADANQRKIDAERRAAAKKRLQLSGSKADKGLGRDAEISILDDQDHDGIMDCDVDRDLDGPIASAFDGPQAYAPEPNEPHADACGPLSVAEVGSFTLEGGWYVSCASCNRCH